MSAWAGSALVGGGSKGGGVRGRRGWRMWGSRRRRASPTRSYSAFARAPLPPPFPPSFVRSHALGSPFSLSTAPVVPFHSFSHLSVLAMLPVAVFLLRSVSTALTGFGLGSAASFLFRCPRRAGKFGRQRQQQQDRPLPGLLMKQISFIPDIHTASAPQFAPGFCPLHGGPFELSLVSVSKLQKFPDFGRP